MDKAVPIGLMPVNDCSPCRCVILRDRASAVRVRTAGRWRRGPVSTLRAASRYTSCEQSRDKKLNYRNVVTLGSSEPSISGCEANSETGAIMVPALGPADAETICAGVVVNFNSVWKRSPSEQKVGWRNLNELIAENSWVAIGGLTNLCRRLVQFSEPRRLVEFHRNHRLEEVHNFPRCENLPVGAVLLVIFWPFGY